MALPEPYNPGIGEQIIVGIAKYLTWFVAMGFAFVFFGLLGLIVTFVGGLLIFALIAALNRQERMQYTQAQILEELRKQNTSKPSPDSDLA